MRFVIVYRRPTQEEILGMMFVLRISAAVAAILCFLRLIWALA